MAKFESQERRMPKIEACLKANGLESLDACREMPLLRLASTLTRSLRCAAHPL